MAGSFFVNLLRCSDREVGFGISAQKQRGEGDRDGGTAEMIPAFSNDRGGPFTSGSLRSKHWYEVATVFNLMQR